MLCVIHSSCYTFFVPTSTTRQLIINYLAETPTATASEISARLRLTPADIRYQLSNLLLTHQIEVIQVPLTSKAHRGRPARAYRLSQRDQLTPLTASLLDLWMGSFSAENSRQNWQTLAAHMSPNFSAQRSLPARLQQAIEWLNAHAYHARWEAHVTGPRIFLHACPYASLWTTQPQLCQLDQLVLENMTGLPALQTQCFHLSPSTRPTCIFQLALRQQSNEAEPNKPLNLNNPKL